MRAYIATTAGEISTFMKDGSWEPVSVYAPTIKFTTANNELDEEDENRLDDTEGGGTTRVDS